jgi:chemotaxis protein CheX
MPTITDLDTLIGAAVAEVFSTMLNYSIKPTSAPIAGANGSNGSGLHVAGAVGFGGVVTGVVYIVVTTDFAREITSRFLGIPPQEIDGESMVNDAIGEMANMVVGQIKSRLCDRGMACVLTIPSIVRGNSFSVEGCSTDEHDAFRFACENNELTVEVLIKPNGQSRN